MNIHNVRLGFATNSSSQHSMIFLKGQKDKLIGDKDHDYEFGWQHFIAASKETKEAYFAALVLDTLRKISDNSTAKLVVSDLLGRNMKNFDGYIDHQSVYSLPFNWDGNGIDYEFIKDLKEFLTQENLVILGGNDNEGNNKNKKAFNLPMPKDDYKSKLVARKDPKGFWTLFNRSNGAKFRFSFSNILKNVPEKAYAPELIDIKITDFCSRNCYFCYQNSSINGKHADWKNGYALTQALKELKVFEVAIGGGEPTSHPRFVNILHDFKSNGIVPSFSTRDLSWLKDPCRWRPILESTGSFAYSIDEPEQSIEEFAAILNANGFRKELGDLIPEPTVHHIMIGGWNGNFEHLLKSAAHHNIHVVLLGYKFTGRGANEKPKDHEDWIDVVSKLNDNHECPRLSIDTTLAKMFAKKLKSAGIPDWLIETKEGSFSMYMDLVSNKMGPSSFCSKDKLVDLNISYSDDVQKQIVKAFSSW